MSGRLWFAIGVALLAGCRGIPAAADGPIGTLVGASDGSPAAVAHRERIRRLGLADGACAAPDWSMTGRVALSNGKDGGSGRLEWVQAGGRLHVGLTAPVTRQGWALEVDAGGATLEGVPGGPLRGGDAAALLRERTGWDIPVAGLGCWVRGAWANAAAFGEARVAYGVDGQVQRIEQGGWAIDYTHWARDPASGVDLPGRISAVRGQDRVRLVVDRWHVD